MRTSPRTTRLGGVDLAEPRHVCALIDGQEPVAGPLLPFIVEGLLQGERAVHVIDPATIDAHLERLGGAGVDVEAASATRQLDVRSWTDGYLRRGAFDGDDQLRYLREVLDEGRALGFPRTRFIGSTEWATEGGTAADLLAYESRVDDLLRRRPDVLICTYDLARHSARTIADAMATHTSALVNGVLHMSRQAAPASARDRLLEAAIRLFTEKGIQATGVDSIIEAAGVAKATFYRHFPSKDDLVIAWLRDPRARWFDRVRAQAATGSPEPDEELLLLFDALADWLAGSGFRGCPYLNTAVEVTDPAHPALTVVRDYLDEIEDHLRGLAAAAGYAEPGPLARRLHALMAGAISLAVARRDGGSSLAARHAAQRLLERAPRNAAH